MWSNISKLTQFDIFIGLHEQSHNVVVFVLHVIFCRMYI